MIVLDSGAALLAIVLVLLSAVCVMRDFLEGELERVEVAGLLLRCSRSVVI